MPSEVSKILGFNQYQKSDKVPVFIYADLECLIKNIDGCKKIVLKIHPQQNYVKIFHQVKVRTQGWGGESHDKSVRVRARGGKFKPCQYVHISTVYFPFLKIFSIKKKIANYGGFIDVTSE